MDPQGKYIITDLWVSYTRPRSNWRACSWLMPFSLEMMQKDKDTRKQSDRVSWHQCPPLKDLKNQVSTTLVYWNMRTSYNGSTTRASS